MQTKNLSAQTSNDIALGVADRPKALEFYVGVLGFELSRENGDWAELKSGAHTLYIVQDGTTEPCFELLVDNVDEACAEIEKAGGSEVKLSTNVRFMRDPFGYLFCVSERKKA